MSRPAATAHRATDHRSALILLDIDGTLLAMIGPVVSVGSAVVAFALFAELPTGSETLGSLILVAGVLYVIVSEARARDPF